MKRFILTALGIFALCLCAFAQKGQIDDLLEKARRHRLTLDYEYVIQGMPDITVDGSAVVQGDCFRMEGAGIMILCDAVNIWTLDLDGKEAYVEAAGKMDYLDFVSDLELEDNGWLSGLYNEPLSGSMIPFTVKNIKFLPPSGDMSAFSPAEDTFSGDWIITDLR